MTLSSNTPKDLIARPRVLAIVDRSEDLLALDALLTKKEFDFDCASSRAQGLEFALRTEYAVILLDIQMPEMNGYEVLKNLKDLSKSATTPIVLITTKSLTRNEETQAYQIGIADILWKPVFEEILEAKLRFFTERYSGNRMKNEVAQSRHFIGGENEMAKLIRSHDWKSHSLGSPEAWPLELKSSVSLMLNSGFPMFIAWGEEGTFFYNDAYAPILGSEKHQKALGARFENIWSDIWKDLSPIVEKVYQGVSTYFEDLPLYMNRSGYFEQTYFTFSYSPISDSSGDVVGLFCACVETTARKTAEEDTTRSERELVDALESMSDAFFSLDKDWRFTRVNRQHEKVVQLGREHQIGKSIIDVWFNDPKYEDSLYLKSYRKVMTERVPVTFEDYYDSLELWTEIRAFPKSDGGIAAFFTDITERKKNEAELVAQREKLEAVFHGTDSPMVLFRGSELVYEMANRKYLALISNRDVIGKKLSEALPEIVNSEFHSIIKRVHDTGEAMHLLEGHTQVLNAATGEVEDRFFDTTFTRINEGSGKQYMVIGHAMDVTERVQSRVVLEGAKKEAELARIEAERANQLKSAFLANMSHEIRTPLAAILGFSILLKESNIDSSEKDRYLDTIVRNGNSLTTIIDDILDLAKVEAGKLDIESIPFSLYTLVTDVVDIFKDKTREKNIYLFLNVDEGVPSQICTDPTRVRQILVNLIGNAVKFTDKGGVRVNVRATPAACNKIKIIIDVKDTGIGLTEEQKEKLFTPFTQADNSMTRKFGGTGLGLALSQRLSHALLGEITITSGKLGEGCIFTLIFEADLTESKTVIEIKDRKSVASQAISLKGFRVLVVDDSPDNQFLVERLLTKNGATVDTAQDGEEGVAKALSGSFDVVLMDIQMPKLDGYQAKKALDKSGYKKPVIALTAHAMSDERIKTQAAGFAGHLTKPLNGTELLNTLASFSRSLL